MGCLLFSEWYLEWHTLSRIWRTYSAYGKNTDCGIFGKINDWNFITQGLINHPLPVGFGAEIKQGAAEILTVVEGEKVEAFEVEIVKIMPNAKKGKELVLKVTDERLLGKTGGIVQ